jgi:hypothetical protein
VGGDRKTAPGGTDNVVKNRWDSTLRKRGTADTQPAKLAEQGTVGNFLKARPALLALPIEKQLQ